MAETAKPKVVEKRKRGPAKGVRVGGRQKGTPNKTTVAVKEALTQAFDQLGGVPSLVSWAASDPAEFYKIWAKLLPAEFKAVIEIDGGLAERMQRSRARAKKKPEKGE